MRKPTLVLAALTLSACALPAQKEVPKAETAPAQPAEIVVLVSKSGQEARDLMHELAARCWLDGIVQGAQLIVKPDGNLVIVGDTKDLLAAEYVGPKGSRTRWRLTGAVIEEPERTRQLVRSIDMADNTGETACPRATG